MTRAVRRSGYISFFVVPLDVDRLPRSTEVAAAAAWRVTEIFQPTGVCTANVFSARTLLTSNQAGVQVEVRHYLI